jgi:ubiquinone/menaquinone biosynthesis C-methylase UbiE
LVREPPHAPLAESAGSAIAEEEERIRSIYFGRDASGRGSLYAWWKPDVLLNLYRFQAEAAACLRKAGWEDLSRLRVLDVGCGSGGWLRQLCAWGACADNLHGIDLLQDRIAAARELSPQIDFRVGSAWQLPFEDASMDLVTAHTVFSSVPNAAARQRLAHEMRRMLKGSGRILIFDFRIRRPGNYDTVGIRRKEIRRLFPGFQLASRTLNLAPPLLRAIAPASQALAILLEALCPFLRTHAMYLLEPSVKEGPAA